MSTHVPYCPIFTVTYPPVGNTSPHKLVVFIVIRFPELGTLSTRVLPRPDMIHNRGPDNDQIR